MRLTPIDLLNREFHRTVRGYAPNEVDDLLREVSADYEQCLTENARLSDAVTRLEAETAHFREIDATLKQALHLAERVAEDARAAAKTEAEAIVRAGMRQADALVEDAARSAEEMRLKRIQFAGEYRGLLLAELAALDDAMHAGDGRRAHIVESAADHSTPGVDSDRNATV